MYTNQTAFEQETGAFCWAFNHPGYWFRFTADVISWAIEFRPLCEQESLARAEKQAEKEANKP